MLRINPTYIRYIHKITYLYYVAMFQDIPIIPIFRYTYVQTCTSTGTDKAILNRLGKAKSILLLG